jgi:excisionase family DNA binding protein
MKKGGLPIGKIITLQELCQYLKLSEATIYKLASRGELPGFKIGDSWRFNRDEILKLMRGAKIAKKNRNTKGTKENSGVGQSRGAGEKRSGVDGQGDPAEVGQNRGMGFNLREF